MILNVICDDCESATASRVIFETKWEQRAVCDDCHDEIDHDSIYACKFLWTDVKQGLIDLVRRYPGYTTRDYVDLALEFAVIPVFLTPFDSHVKKALRNKNCFRSFKEEGSNALRYEVEDS